MAPEDVAVGLDRPNHGGMLQARSSPAKNIVVELVAPTGGQDLTTGITYSGWDFDLPVQRLHCFAMPVVHDAVSRLSRHIAIDDMLQVVCLGGVRVEHGEQRCMYRVW